MLTYEIIIFRRFRAKAQIGTLLKLEIRFARSAFIQGIYPYLTPVPDIKRIIFKFRMQIALNDLILFDLR